MEKIVTVKNLSKSYGKQLVLDDISFEIYKGEIVGFIGPNGAGKSTLMKCMCNLINIDAGSINICGYDLVKDRKNALKKQASLIEGPGLFLTMTGLQNIKLFASLHDVSKQRLQEMIDYSRLGKHINKKVSAYSLGMKQRLALAIALLSEPNFLMLDEPMNGLDPTGIFELREELRNMVNKYNMALLISSHQLNEIEKIADRIIYLDHGKINEVEKNSTTTKYIIKLDKALTNYNNDYECMAIDNLSYQFTIKDEKELSQLIQNLVLQKLNILDVIKIEDDLEDEYSKIYEVTK
ncbi:MULTISPECIES: ABC transporter ATP-binding protein [Bacillota]|jgi:ABC-2 type transport system ATP-binding protein|uniref:ABC transporter ATP-binding protein n=2 Tax=Amedibacillus TaxID=2749846 RepID=A0A7G9GQX4_9FIRM|nr:MULTISPECIES: ABC transporter ATP-binding protein [Bacillota]QNM13206.1 ABC transporter ATP-binding protein [[Eubacterium] hominis]RGB49842.1 ABC transporter ATP-binding protein [Absiella sp. AM22-9]RGB52055.1 ABC transporter ATP-binding protein [Absiella sp. AM10-20]RGB64068.1 ABC transporter ATP-binding protein [Absiella sp. AM09-45]RGB72995.1 ABC transporter ATP-binding protein [Absiella sp. AM09-50]